MDHRSHVFEAFKAAQDEGYPERAAVLHKLLGRPEDDARESRRRHSGGGRLLTEGGIPETAADQAKALLS